jgi:hypothetical protein
MLIVPLVTVGKNLFKTMEGNFHMVILFSTIRFAFFGAVIFCVATALSIIFSLRGPDSVVHFTLFNAAMTDLLLYGFYSMVMFGAIYYITPRLVGCEWLSSEHDQDPLPRFSLRRSDGGGGHALRRTRLPVLARWMRRHSFRRSFTIRRRTSPAGCSL